MSTPLPVREWRDVSATIFRSEILPAQQPALIRGAVRDWPVVRAATSPQALVNYLRGFDTGSSAETMHGDPSIGGRFFYNEDLSGLNFERTTMPLARSLDRLLEMLGESAPPALYVGALAAPAALPGFAEQNTFALAESIVPRLWLSNRVTVQTHYDLSYNLACVVGGRRRFTLFPPEQIANLYVGPLEFTLAGQPISMVRLDAPDHARFPRFREALAQAQVAEMEPGDSLFIPYMWWHHVEALDPFNLLVNYWWDDTPPWNGSPFEALFHALMSVHSLPPDKRAIWKKVFEHHVFETDGSATEHLPPAKRGIQGTLDKQLALHMRSWLLRALTPRRR
jgi:Cupin-like domain